MFTLLIICLIRACLFKPAKEEKKEPQKVSIDKEKAVTSLQALVSCRTVSNLDKSKEDEKEFDKLKKTLRDLYPAVYQAAEFTELSSRELLFHIAGKSEDKKHASIMMAHFDVVDVVEENWKHPAFAGFRENGVLWGRGTIDTKGTLNGVLRSSEELFEKGFVPEHDLYFAFAGDEEIQGGSAKLAVKYFQDHGIEPLIVVDEGGGVVNGVFPGVTRPTALIGTAEKGALALEYHIDGEGGHASAPKPHTPVGELAQLAVEMEKHPFKMHLCQPVKEMFSTLGREAPFKYRFIFANLWLFKPVLNKLTKKTGGQLNALVRTTCALTMMEGAPVTNVIPSEAMIGANLRLLPGDDLEEAKAKYVEMAKKLGLKGHFEYQYGWNASRVSRTDTSEYKKMEEAIVGTWGKETIVSPFIMTACADARHYGAISDRVYRFSAMKLRADQLGMIHGDNEQLNDEQIAETVEFYYRLIKSL